MLLKILTWNLRRATHKSEAWDIIRRITPDLLILQEVASIPNDLLSTYLCLSKKARSKGGREQSFSTTILSRKGALKHYSLYSSIEWIQNELTYFNGNILAAEISIENQKPIRIVSVYSPAWFIPKARLEGIDVSDIKLTQNNNLYCTELLWAALKEESNNEDVDWIIAGDFNSSTTFDIMWPGGPSGNQEIIDRMNSLGLTECLYTAENKLVPTFKNARGNKVVHQMDHIFVSQCLFNTLKRCCVLDKESVFEKSLSDHLPIITEFKLV